MVLQSYETIHVEEIVTKTALDPRPFEQRPVHWNYSRHARCWQRDFNWDERVAMSELGIGPEHVRKNDEKRVGFVSLRGRNISDELLSNLAAFEFLTTVVLVGSTVTDLCVPHLLALPNLKWLWIADTKITQAAARSIEKAKPECLVFRKGEGAIQDPTGEWIKITTEWWPTNRPRWKFW